MGAGNSAGVRTRPGPEESAVSQPRDRLVREHLHEILASEAFRGSKRSSDFLHFVVEKTLAGQAEDLKERTIGVQVYGRPEDYDTADDPVVRVRANEVRKRLAQYYMQSGNRPFPVRIELPAGHYVPQFHFDVAGTGERETAPAAAASRKWRPAAVLAVAALAATALWLTSRPDARPGILEQFWGPALRGPEAVLICLAHPVVYMLSPEVHREYLDKLAGAGREPTGPYIVQLDRGVLPARDVIPVPDQYVGVGDAYSAALLTGLFTRLGKASRLRIGSDTSFSDLRNYPAVLLGANSNRWTMTLTQELPFVFRRGFGAFYIQETAAPQRVWKLTALRPDGKTPEDFALVSRLVESHSGRMVVAGGGITQYGTQAVGEFLTSPKYLSQLLASAPPHWEKRNLQCVVHTRITDNTPGPPRVVAVRFW